MNLIQLFYVEFDRKQKLTNKGIETKGVVQAMTFLTQQTKSLYGEVFPDQIKAKDVIVGGGDTGSDCVNFKQTGAKSVTNFEIMPKPPVGRRNYALAILAFAVKTSSSHEEGCEKLANKY
jgi:glutamate synthase (NADPH/NADH) small chain